MKLSAKPEGVMERMALLLNLAPLPLIDTQIAFSNARTIMAAAALGMFEQLGQGEKTADEIAAACQTNPVATQHLLNCLVGIGYARWSRGKYGMQRAHRKWLLRVSPNSVVNKLVFQLLSRAHNNVLAHFCRPSIGEKYDKSAIYWNPFQAAPFGRLILGL